MVNIKKKSYTDFKADPGYRYARKVVQIFKTGEIIRFESSRDLADHLGVKRPTVYRYIKTGNWKFFSPNLLAVVWYLNFSYRYSKWLRKDL